MMICQQYGIVKMLKNLIILQEEQKQVARIVKLEGVRVEYDLDQVTVPDPISSQLCTLSVHIKNLEKKIEELQNYSEEAKK